MPSADESARFCADLMAGLADAGVTLVLVSPGSRNTPLTLAAVAEPRLRTESIRDERSAGFIALGHAKATGVPAAVVCMSGSAATHYYPAVVEADQSATPLIVLTADRPARLRDTFAPQTMNQVDLYGNHVITSTDVDATAENGRAAGHTAVLRSTGPIPGPVHLNLPFDEPLTPDTAVGPSAAEIAPRPEAPRPLDPPIDIGDAQRVLFVVSGPIRPQGAAALAATAHAWQAPVLVDAQTTFDGSTIVEYPDLIAATSLADGTRLLDQMAPDHIIRIGPLPTSKPLWQWLETCSIPQTLVSPTRLQDPLGTAEIVVAPPSSALAGMHAQSRGDRAYLERWQLVDLAVAAMVSGALAELPFPNEPEIARAVGASIGPSDALFMASSMPIRDVDGFAPRSRAGLRIANRGVNGIDGNLSTALGVAMTGTPTTALVGDIAALHDVSALAEAAGLGAPLRVVVVNNDGGGIFSFLPQATSNAVDPSDFESMWGTPHGISIAPIAAAMGIPARSVSTRTELTDAVATPPTQPELIELTTDRHRNVDDHRAVRQRVAEVVADVLAEID